MSSTNLRKFMDLVEYGPKLGTTDSATTYRDLEGRQMNSNITYDVSPDKVVAKLQSYNSQIYTKLAQKINRISALEQRVKQLKEEVKQEGRDHVSDLFSADDVIRTRVVETVSFIFKLTKDPAPTKTVKYAEVLKELETHLTPELITVLESLKKKYESTTQKAAALSVTKVAAKESMDLAEDGMLSKMKDFFHRFLATITNWGNKYDSKLDALKSQVAMAEDVTEAPETMAFGVGDTVYYGSRSGKVIKKMQDNPNNIVVELPNGQMDVFPANKCSTEKPGMMNRMASWVVGEDETLDGDDEQGLTEKEQE